MHAEIGATAVHPADVTMRRGIMMGYVTIVCAYLMVSITGAARPPRLHAQLPHQRPGCAARDAAPPTVPRGAAPVVSAILHGIRAAQAPHAHASVTPVTEPPL